MTQSEMEWAEVEEKLKLMAKVIQDWLALLRQLGVVPSAAFGPVQEQAMIQVFLEDTVKTLERLD